MEFLSPFLWRAPPPEMRRECRKFFPDQAGKGSLISSYFSHSLSVFLFHTPYPLSFSSFFNMAHHSASDFLTIISLSTY